MKNIAVKIDKISSWILFFVIMVYAVTGFGMTKGFIDSSFSRAWHLGYLGGIGLAAFVVHTFRAFYLELRNKNLWNIFTKMFLILFYLFLVIFFCYLQFFYQENRLVGVEQKNKIDQTGNSVNGENENVFTAETLKLYNGLNGHPAYVAVNGIVYDVSSLFVNGEHYGCKAGMDVSSEFNSERKHKGNILSGYKVVGVYK
ncbi:MAG: hypothetical protein WCX74_03425 [Candidatus Paceibacterota bacterium]